MVVGIVPSPGNEFMQGGMSDMLTADVQVK